MELKLDKVLEDFNLAETAEIDCGSFDWVIRQAAAHNTSFRAAATARSLKVKRKSVARIKGTMTGDEQEDVELFLDLISVGWGKRKLKNDAGEEVEYSKDVARSVFAYVSADGRPAGKVLFQKLMQMATTEDMFLLNKADAKN